MQRGGRRHNPGLTGALRRSPPYLPNVRPGMSASSVFRTSALRLSALRAAWAPRRGPVRAAKTALWRRLALWLALCAVSFTTAAPVLATVMASAVGGDWVQVCTAQGMRWVAVNVDPADNASNPATAPAAAMEHCPVCSQAHHGLAGPPAPGLSLPAVHGRTGPPERFAQAPCTAHAWVSAQPRAPPAAALHPRVG